MTMLQRANLNNHLANMDEVGGDELGKTKTKVYKPKNATLNKVCWRTTNLAGDHNPFHVTVVLTSLASLLKLQGQFKSFIRHLAVSPIQECCQNCTLTFQITGV